jgi:hypothetical protein
LNNSALGSRSGAGVFGGSVTNSIIRYNYSFINEDNYDGAFGAISMAYSCTTPLPSGPGNIANSPEIGGDFYLRESSPCRGRGSPLVTYGTDIDGDAWLNPPSMGCDEYQASSVVGPLLVSLSQHWPDSTVGQRHDFFATYSGRISGYEFAFGDGPPATNGLNSHIWTNSGDYVVRFSVFNTDHPNGVSTNLSVHVYPFITQQFSSAGFVGTNFSLSYAQLPDVVYYVETTTNLVPPISWAFFYYGSGPLTNGLLLDTRATNEAKFYRMRNL